MRTTTLERNMLDAKSQLSKLVKMVEDGEVDEVVIARNGRPAARLLRVRAQPRVRLGVAKGRFRVPESIDLTNEQVLELFETVRPDESRKDDAPAP